MKEKKVLFIIFMMLFIIMGNFILNGCSYRKSYNNDESIENLITEKHETEEFEKFTSNWHKYNYSSIKKTFKIECKRKTCQGYYAVFLRQDNARLFVFFDEDFNVSNYYLLEKSYTFSDFEFIKIGVTSQEEVESFDSNTIIYPTFSADYSTKHILKDGVLIIDYDYNSIVKACYVISDEEITEEYSNQYIPLILSIDK